MLNRSFNVQYWFVLAIVAAALALLVRWLRLGHPRTRTPRRSPIAENGTDPVATL